MEMNVHELELLSERFEKQFSDVNVNEFCNPTLAVEDATTLEFRCYYNNYDNEDDSWTWYYNKKTKVFFN